MSHPHLPSSPPQLPPSFSSSPAAERAACSRLFFDVDDTLTWHGRLPDEAVRALYRARDAGLSLCAVTGRSFAWGELLVRLFPLDAVVAETGASALYFDGQGRLQALHHEDDDERARLSQVRAHAAVVALNAIKTARLALDNVGRVADTAFDLVESGDPVPEDDIIALRDVLHAAGLQTARSSVHVNSFAYGQNGAFDKATMVDRLLRHTAGVSLDDASATLCYVGDSGNDGPLFARAALSVGVGNIVTHLPGLVAASQAPRYMVDGFGGYGFAAVVNALLDAKADRDVGVDNDDDGAGGGR